MIYWRRENRGSFSVCILYVFWWSCGPYWRVFLKHELIIISTVRKKWLKLRNWNFWISLNFPSIRSAESFPFFGVISSPSLRHHVLVHITPCLFPPQCHSLLLCQDVSQHLASFLVYLFLPYFSITPSHPSFHPLSPSFLLGAKSRQLPLPSLDTGGGLKQQRGGLCSQIDLCRVHQTDEPGRSLPGLNSMHDTLICHALAGMSTPAKTLSWLPSQLSPYSLST